jgi:hypothetical protein
VSYVLDWAATRRHKVDQFIPYQMPMAAVLAIAAILVALAYGMNNTSYLIWGGFWVAPVLLIFSLPVANRAARLDGETIGRIVMVAAIIKIFVTPLLRYWMAFSLYGGSADAALYHRSGALLAPLFRQGTYRDLGEFSGTRFIELLTGQVYALTGPTRLGAFMVFSWFSFLGLYLFYRAFRTAHPEGDGRRYALLVFFFPSLMFWPSSLGKEGFMMLMLGVAALGAAKLLTSQLRGLVWLALGLGGTAVVRPHLTLIVCSGLAVAAPFALLRAGPDGYGAVRGRLGGAVLLVGLLLGGSTLVGVTEKFFDLESLNTQTAQEQLVETIQQSEIGRSEFTATSPNDPVGFVSSSVTVLFRPFVFEVRNVAGILTGLEGVMLLGLCALSLRRLARMPAEVARRPYIAFALVYVFAFIYAFSSIANFGILARQRVQVLPVLFVILCLQRKDQVAEGDR